MPDLSSQLVPFLMVAARLSGVFMLAPLLGSVMIPAKVRVLLLAALSVAVYPALPARAVVPMEFDVFTVAAAATGEVLIGACIGLLALLPVTAVQLAGLLMGLQMGMGLAAIANPALETESEPIGELLSYLALTIFAAIGGLEATFLSVIKTFAHTPAGAFTIHIAPLELVTGALASGFELALRVSLPLMGIITLETIATSFLAKSIPTINIVSIGFGLKIMLGLGAIVLGLNAMDQAIADHLTDLGRRVLFWSAHP